MNVKNLYSLVQKLTAIALLSFLSACSLTGDDGEHSAYYVDEPLPLGNVEYHTALLANELFAGIRPNKQYRYAVAGFVPVDDMKFNPNDQHPLMLLGHQLEQGLITEATRRGLVTQDYKTTKNIIVSSHGDAVFSRDVSKLSANQSVDFFISGTLTEQQEGFVVNARVIHVRSNDVVAAATKFFPSELFWEREKVSTRNGKIYRTGSY